MQFPRSSALRTICFVLVVATAIALGQSREFVAITPHAATMTVGDSRTFRFVNQDGHMEHDVAWAISDSTALETSGGDEVTVTTKRAGEFRLRAHSAAGSDEIFITVIQGAPPNGTIVWSAPTVPGCKSVKITQAVPTATGPDLYEESQCQDGYYVTALTADGRQLWRRNITAEAHQPGAGPAAVANQRSGKPLNIHSTSVCDSISSGMEQEKVRILMAEHNLKFSDNGGFWTIEEEGAECRLWFDEKAVLTKKRKTLVVE
jgi:hypothetical protein